MISINDTPLVPYIIAQGVMHDLVSARKHELGPERCHELIETIVPLLEKKAEQVYINNPSWRKLLLMKLEGDGQEGREMFMNFMGNWGEYFLNQELKKAKVIKLK